ncbi:MAG: RcpC/CpaB family pilus assembly protein [Thermoanaerobacterales bacterium]|nr:RcpC/CpaB family pilus assembly protein [Thermoanaerobacterales bacterium]
MSLPVPTRDIPAYTVIASEDVTLKEFVKGAEEPTSAREPKDVVGYITTAPLTKGWQINKRVLTDKEAFGDKQVVGVNVDAARAGGVKAGDIVDVYWLTPEQGAWTASMSSRLVAQNATVLKVCDERGQPLDETQSVVQGAVNPVAPPKRTPSVVYLLLDPADVGKVIGGAMPKSSFIALAKKTKWSVTPVQEVMPGAESATQGNAAPATPAQTR